LNPTTGEVDGHGFPFPLANNAKLAPSKTKKFAGANASQRDEISVIQTAGLVPTMKPNEYLSGVARIAKVTSFGIVVLFKGICFVCITLIRRL
jgi:hypothetical protein